MNKNLIKINVAEFESQATVAQKSLFTLFTYQNKEIKTIPSERTSARSIIDEQKIEFINSIVQLAGNNILDRNSFSVIRNMIDAYSFSELCSKYIKGVVSPAALNLFQIDCFSSYLLGKIKSEDKLSVRPLGLNVEQPFAVNIKSVLAYVVNEFSKTKSVNESLIAEVATTMRFFVNSHKVSVNEEDLLQGFVFELNEFIFQFMTHQEETSSKHLSVAYVDPSEVIGNEIAKKSMMKMAKMLVLYDFEAKKNPFVEVGAFFYTFIGDGSAGTGKTSLIKMTAGLIAKYCQDLGYDFYYENFHVGNISSYQGESARNARAFVQNVKAINRIGFGTIDDIDQIAGKRSKSSSEGALAITSVLMDEFSGAETKVNGNAVFGCFSNNPDQVDDALRQRFVNRFKIDGLTTDEHYSDMLYMHLKNTSDIKLGEYTDVFNRSNAESDPEYLYEKHLIPQEKELLSIYDGFVAQYGSIDSYDKLGKYLKKINDMDPRFTGRAISNILNTAKSRASEFDIPDEWVEDKGVFIELPYDEKVKKIKALIKPVSIEILLQEIHRYVDSEIRYQKSIPC